MPRPDPVPPLELVEWLERLFPDRFPTVQGHDAVAIAIDLARQQGRLEVVRLLRDRVRRAPEAASPSKVEL